MWIGIPLARRVNVLDDPQVGQFRTQTYYLCDITPFDEKRGLVPTQVAKSMPDL